MKRIWLVSALLSALLLGATPVLAQDGFYVIGVGSAGTKIGSLPYEITSPGLYCLARSLTYSGTTGNAITVNASDVTLDLMGFNLSGPGKTAGGGNLGIFINSGLENVEIRNGSVTSFGSYGIFANNGKGIRAIGLRVRDNGTSGVLMYGSNHRVIGCSLFDNGHNGAQVADGFIKGNEIYENDSTGLIAGSGSTISGNVCRNNGGYGIYTWSGSSVLDNLVLNNTVKGIYTENGCTVTRNTCRGNTGEGIRTGNDCLITNNCTQGLTVGSNCYAVYNRTY
jgi:hypothetical protein